MAVQPVPYRVARIVGVVISAVVWAGILAVAGTAISGAMAIDGLSLGEAQGFFVVICLFVPLFTGQGVVIGMMEGLLDGRFEPPAPPAPPADAARFVQSPWQHGLGQMLRIGAPAAAVSLWLVPTAFAAGVDRWALVGGLVATGATLAMLAGASSHAAFLRALSVPAGQRPYHGDVAGYLGRRQLLPHVLTNIAINAAVGVAVVARPQGLFRSIAPAEVVVGDTVIMAFIIAVAVFAGARTQARTDARWGVLAAQDAAAPGGPLRLVGWVLLSTALSGGAAVLLLLAVGEGGLALPAFVAFKAAAAAVLAALAARRGHRAGLAAA